MVSIGCNISAVYVPLVFSTFHEDLIKHQAEHSTQSSIENSMEHSMEHLMEHSMEHSMERSMDITSTVITKSVPMGACHMAMIVTVGHNYIGHKYKGMSLPAHPNRSS